MVVVGSAPIGFWRIDPSRIWQPRAEIELIDGVGKPESFAALKPRSELQIDPLGMKVSKKQMPASVVSSRNGFGSGAYPGDGTDYTAEIAGVEIRFHEQKSFGCGDEFGGVILMANDTVLQVDQLSPSALSLGAGKFGRAPAQGPK